MRLFALNRPESLVEYPFLHSEAKLTVELSYRVTPSVCLRCCSTMCNHDKNKAKQSLTTLNTYTCICKHTLSFPSLTYTRARARTHPSNGKRMFHPQRVVFNPGKILNWVMKERLVWFIIVAHLRPCVFTYMLCQPEM